jgi:hypothetical protein
MCAYSEYDKHHTEHIVDCSKMKLWATGLYFHNIVYMGH